MTYEQRIERIEAYLNKEFAPVAEVMTALISRMARELAALMEPDAGALRAAFVAGAYWGMDNPFGPETDIPQAEAFRRYPDTPKGDEKCPRGPDCLHEGQINWCLKCSRFYVNGKSCGDLRDEYAPKGEEPKHE